MTNIERTESFKMELKPLYEKLLSNVTKFNYKKATFCMQWGENFPFKEGSGILFVGRATNGWVTECEDVEVLFGDTEIAIFNRSDQMKWVENHSGNKYDYNTNKSAFWRVIKTVTKKIYSEPWYSYVAWSNVCKVAPRRKGNPNKRLRNAQLEVCKRILETEIKILSPKVVVMFTGEDWASDFLGYLNGEQKLVSLSKEVWDKYECVVYKINDVIYIRTEHPQGKKEAPHIQCLIDLIKKNL